MFRFMKTKVAAVLLVVAAISVPTASAQPIGLIPPTARDTSAASGSAGAVRTVEVSSDSFDWGDAAIGAGAILTLLGVGSGVMVIARRRGEPVPIS